MNENKDETSQNRKIRIEKWIKLLPELEGRINYKFKDSGLLLDALTHKSFHPDSKLSKSEKLEFLGDSVLELAVTEAIYKLYPNKTEGELTKLRSKIISSNFLYEKAVECNLAKFIIADKSITRKNLKKNKSFTADAMESMFGAIFLDSSFIEAKYVIRNIVLENLESSLSKSSLKNYKSKLQELSHKKFAANPKYMVNKISGPDHRRKFYVEAIINDDLRAKGKGRSKKSAEQKAARKLLKKIKN